jgi:rare lipoprotein A
MTATPGMKIFYILIFSFGTALFPGHLQAQDDVHTDSRQKPSARIQYGTASYYADKFEGRPTMSDEIFRQSKFTGAHNSLPLGTWVRVTNLRNKKTVIVKINDRLHPKNKRLVDLSKVAAKQLGFLGSGLTKVRLDVLGRNYQQIASQ